ncbi:MAG: serine hydrolase [Oscillospiraceae bacterium]|jgi:hypothetical protein|nr:serine hydrolase [Oscillospiraceae bacterium]
MTKKKPDIFLGITMAMLVLAALLCVIILIVQKQTNSKPAVKPTGAVVSNDTVAPPDTGDTNSSTDATKPSQPVQPADVKAIDETALKAALDDNLEPLSSNWDIVILDPVVGTKVTASHQADPEAWMEVNRMLPVFIMGTAYQQVANGTMTEADIQADVEAMIVGRDYAAADRLTASIGGGDAAKGMQAVKDFAAANGMQISYNRALNETGGKPNYMKASLCAEVLNKICRGELVSADASARMKEIICKAKTDEEIAPTLVTEGASYGLVTDCESNLCCCTMGIVNLPNRSYVVSIFCYDPVNMGNAQKRAAEIIALTEPYFAE